MAEEKQEPEDIFYDCLWCLQRFSYLQESFLGDENVFDLVSSCFPIEFPTNVNGAVCHSCRLRLSRSQQFRDLISESLFKHHLDLSGVGPVEQNSYREFKVVSSPPAYQAVVCKSELPHRDHIQYSTCDGKSYPKANETADGDIEPEKVSLLIETESVDITDDISESVRGDTPPVDRNTPVPPSLRVNIVKLDYFNLTATKESADKFTYIMTPADILVLRTKETEYFKSIIDAQSVFSKFDKIPIDLTNSVENFQCETNPMRCQSKKELKSIFSNKTPLKNNSAIVDDNSENFLCDICCKVFKKKYYLAKHITRHTTERNFKCDVCFKAFKSNRDLKIHMVSHSDERNFLCNICSKSFKSNDYLKNHMISHKDERDVKCNVCFKGFKSNRHLIDHMTSHSDKRDFKCDICLKTFKISSRLKYHMSSHSDERNFKCTVCSKAFKSKSNLIGHMTSHSGDRNFKCDVCYKAFKSSDWLKNHLATHGDERNFQCSSCHKTFKSQLRLKAHMVNHMDVRKFKCDICSKLFKFKYDLKTHMIAHSNVRNFKCDICSKAFKLNNHLQAHITTHSSQRSYECNLCSKKFKSQLRLSVHTSKYHDVRKFKCDICFKEFRFKCDLKVHMNKCCNIQNAENNVRSDKHSKEYGIFQCAHCSKTFKKKIKLIIHVNRHEKKLGPGSHQDGK